MGQSLHVPIPGKCLIYVYINEPKILFSIFMSGKTFSTAVFMKHPTDNTQHYQQKRKQNQQEKW